MDTDEYRRSSGAVASNAIGAWQQGATGRGVTIGFVDTGINPNLPDFAGRIDARSTDVAGSRTMSDPYGHGTAVAGIAAGARDDQGMLGIAYEATIFVGRADSGCPTNCSFDTDNVAQGIDAARESGARVINLSMAGGESSTIANAVKRAANAGIVVVIGAGNDGSQPSALARHLASVAPSNVIIVGALGVTNADGTVNYDQPGKWTTPATGSQNSFLTAPGWLVGGTSAPSPSGYDLFSGTSFSAPVVSGAIALLAQAFPTLTAQQLVTLLYVTADDLGAMGVDSVYGRGRLNIGRAFQPVGTVRMASSGLSLTPGESAVLPAAAGDAARQALLTAVVLDGFDRAFEVDLASSLQQARNSGPLASTIAISDRNVAARVGPMSVAMIVADSAVQGSVVQRLALSSEEQQATRLLAASVVASIDNRSEIAMGFGVSSASLRQRLSSVPANLALLIRSANDAYGFGTYDVRSAAYAYQAGRIGLTVLGESGKVLGVDNGSAPGYSSQSASIDYAFSRGHASATVSRVAENRSFLGGRLPSFMGKAGARTVFADFEFSRRLMPSWTLSAAYRRGWTHASVGQFATSAFSADITKSAVISPRDRVTFRVSQPLRIERGGLNLLLPVSWDYSTEESTTARRRLSLTPSGRELTAEIGYSTAVPGGWMSLNAFGRRNPDHVRGADADLGLAFRLNATL